MSQDKRDLHASIARKRRRNRLHEQLEERILFDAVPDLTTEMFDSLSDDPYVPSVDAGLEHSVNAATAAEQSPEQSRKEFVFVDKSVAGYELLVTDLVISNGAEVIFLDKAADGLSQIADALAGHSGIDAIHIISHGNAAELHLGSAVLTTDSIVGEHSDELAAIRQSLTDSADLLIYGCDFGQGAAGQVAVTALSEATGADIAASDDDTGSASLGGNWNLEVVTGSIEASLVVTTNSQPKWTGLLAATDLQIEISAAPNFVVDSNDPTSGPEAAYISATFTNTGSETLTDVTANIGNYVDGVNDTPGLYPTRNHTGLTGTFSLTHEGGSAGYSDATRNVGDLAPGQSVTHYWLVSYPKVDDNGDSVVQGSKPADDLFLNYDIWVTGNDSGGPISTVESNTVYLRSEISASANKIWPNGDNKVPDTYKQAIGELLGWDWSTDSGNSSAAPGEIITTQGIWYDLGNVGQGFDNDGDLVPDRNVFLQPVGDPEGFDAGAFRLVRSYGLLIIKNKGGGETLIAFEDQLYHSHLPDNTGAVGLVYYEFAAIDAGASGTITAYQEVASGNDNEKYSGDYGRGITLTTSDSTVVVDKSVDQLTITDGAAATLTYTIDVTNTSATISVGNLDFGLPVVIEDSIPDGTIYVAGSAAVNNALPSGVSAYTIRYSDDNGVTWTATEPTASSVTDIQWWLDAALAPAGNGNVTFQVDVPAAYSGLLVPNEGGVSFAGGTLFASDTALTTVAGTNTIGNMVFGDDGGTTGTAQNGIQDGDEAGLASIGVSLYYDTNANQVIDADDILWATTTTADGTGADPTGYYSFSGVPDADFLIQVDATDADRPTGWSLLSDQVVSVALNGDYLDADFAFTPSLIVDKAIVGAGPIFEGDEVSYTIDVTNLVSVQGNSELTVWGTQLGTDQAFKNPGNALNAPDGVYADDNFANSKIDIRGFDTGTSSGAITKVELVSSIYFDGVIDNDQFFGEIFVGGTSVAATTYANPELNALGTTAADQGLLVWDVTSQRTWSWADFATLEFQHNSLKQAGPDAIIYLDGVGLRITTDAPPLSFSADSSLVSVPLVDDYDESRLEFVSASVAPNSVDTVNGILTWNSLGTINGGETAQVTVTFKALEPTGNSPQTNISNTA